MDEVFHYFLASCPFLENLCLKDSWYTKNLKVVDPLPSLKHLEISQCTKIQSLEISVSTLVSITYDGEAIGVPFKKVPNLSELTLAGEYCEDFIFESDKHYNYVVGLEKLALELPNMYSRREISVPPDFPLLCSLKQLELTFTTIGGRSLLFFLSFIKSFPLLHSLKFQVVLARTYNPPNWISYGENLIYPEVETVDTNGFYLEHLKVLEMSGYIGSKYGCIELLWELVDIAPALELIVMDLRCPCEKKKADDVNRVVASGRKRVNKLRNKLPPQIQLIVL